MQLLCFPENCCLNKQRQTLQIVFIGVPTIFCIRDFPPSKSLKTYTKQHDDYSLQDRFWKQCSTTDGQRMKDSTFAFTVLELFGLEGTLLKVI